MSAVVGIVPMVGVLALLNMGIPLVLLGVLQYFLSKTESPWPGRILPILAGVYAVGIDCLLLLGLAGNLGYGGHSAGAVSLLMMLLSGVIVFVPMVVYIVIYKIVRKNKVAKKDMDRMSIQDLE